MAAEKPVANDAAEYVAHLEQEVAFQAVEIARLRYALARLAPEPVEEGEEHE
jgi:hypothetical protein